MKNIGEKISIKSLPIAVGFLCVLLIGCSSSPSDYKITNATANGVEVYGGSCFTPDVEGCIRSSRIRALQHCTSYGKQSLYVGSGSTYSGMYYRCVENLKNQSSPQSSLSVALSSAPTKSVLKEYVDCVRVNIIALDDLQSDASTIASAIAYACSTKYTRYVTEVISQVNLFDHAKDKLKESFKSVEVQKVIPYVLAWRQVVRRGFNKSQKPTEKELPNNLYQVDLKISL